jgi:F-type H+-transporting ATPase subunit epsilon
MSDSKTKLKPPKERSDFDIVVVTPDKVIFEDVATLLIAPGPKQDLGILPNHAPLYSEVNKGDLQITLKSGKIKTIPIEAGVVRVRNNQVSVVMGFAAPEVPVAK